MRPGQGQGRRGHRTKGLDGGAETRAGVGAGARAGAKGMEGQEQRQGRGKGGREQHNKGSAGAGAGAGCGHCNKALDGGEAGAGAIARGKPQKRLGWKEQEQK